MDPQQLPATPAPRPGPRRGPGGAPQWLWWVVVIAVLALIAVAVVVLTRDDDATPSAEPTATTPATTTDEPTDAATEPPSDDPPAESTMPLKAPEESRFVDGVSAIPTTPDLPDGDYLAHLTGIDTAARTVTFDVEIMYTDQAANDYLAAHDPAAENPPPNGYVMVNESTNTRTLPLADDARIWDWCTGGAGLEMAERPFAEWAAAPADGDTTCGLGAALSHGSNEVYWFDVRSGVVEQVVGQYLP